MNHFHETKQLVIWASIFLFMDQFFNLSLKFKDVSSDVYTWGENNLSVFGYNVTIYFLFDLY